MTDTSNEFSPERIDAWLMGNAWVGSGLEDVIQVLCGKIGVRWAGTEAEREAADFICQQFESIALSGAAVEPFDLRTWNCQRAQLTLGESHPQSLPIRPCLFCPPANVTGRLVDIGFGMDHELERLADRLDGSIALINPAFEPFSAPKALVARLESLSARGVKAAICYSPHFGRRLTLMSGSDWHDDEPLHVTMPFVQTAREDSGKLQCVLETGGQISIDVESEFSTRTSWNCVAQIPGNDWPDESIVLAAHHDTTPESPGANDNAAGVAVVLEVARLLAGISKQESSPPGRTIRFVSFGAEEQGLQGSTAYVQRHHGPEPPPRLMLNLDELGVGAIKGVILQFPELRPLVQKQLDEMNEGLRCHVLDHFDPSGDMFPFARVGIPSGMMWRWRFVGRHPHAEYGHCSSDTPEKLRFRELKEYAGNLARLMYRLSHVPPEEWPQNRLDPSKIARQIASERCSVLRTM